MKISEKTRENALNKLLLSEKAGDIYGELSVLRLIEGFKTEESLEALLAAAEWFDRPHPLGKTNYNGESDFVAIRIIPAIYEKKCSERLPEGIKSAIKAFYTENDFKSEYGSENHILMFRVARLLAAEFYKGEFFKNYNMTAEEIVAADTVYLNEFIDYRAAHGWGEFDSLGYTAEDMLILNTLYFYTADKGLKNKAKMMMDILILDMIADSMDYIYGGAHGRSYPNQVMNAEDNEISRLYKFYFGFSDECPNVITYLSDYQPSDIVYEIAENKKYPYENREQKHLHCWSVWVNEIKHEELNGPYGTINKYTYLTDDYVIGAVNLQGKYPDYSPDRGYAFHQQHNLELSFIGNPRHKIFSHHPGKRGDHNHWTGDAGCSCGSYYANKNTAISMYNIEKADELQYIHTYLPRDAFKSRIDEEKYHFFEYGKLYIAYYLSNGCHSYIRDEYEELVTYGSQHAVVLRVEYKDKFTSLESFAEEIKKIPVEFNREAKTVKFDGIELRTDGNSEGGVENIYPYKKTYDCYFMQSDWGSKKIEIKTKDKSIIYDFDSGKITEKH